MRGFRSAGRQGVRRELFVKVLFTGGCMDIYYGVTSAYRQCPVQEAPNAQGCRVLHRGAPLLVYVLRYIGLQIELLDSSGVGWAPDKLINALLLVLAPGIDAGISGVEVNERNWSVLLVNHIIVHTRQDTTKALCGGNVLHVGLARNIRQDVAAGAIGVQSGVANDDRRLSSGLALRWHVCRAVGPLLALVRAGQAGHALSLPAQQRCSAR